MGQKAISYIGPSIWNTMPYSIKTANSLNTFKRNIKKHYLTWITHVFMWICVYVFKGTLMQIWKSKTIFVFS